MRRLLLDTHVFLWWLSDDPAFGAAARQMIGEPRNQVLVSAASIWEISIKQAKGMLEAPEDLEALVEDEVLPNCRFRCFMDSRRVSYQRFTAIPLIGC